MANPSTHCISYSPRPANDTVGSCASVVGCLTPGSIPIAALAPGPLPASITIASTAISFASPAAVGTTGLLSMGGQAIQLMHPVSSLGTPRTDYWAFPA